MVGETGRPSELSFRKPSKAFLFLLSTLLLVATVFPGLRIDAGDQSADPAAVGVVVQGSQDYTLRGPINILGDNQFTAGNGVVAGNGTRENPYVIAGWEINLSATPPRQSWPSGGIVIANTNRFYVIRDVFIHDGVAESWVSSAITLYMAHDGRIENVTVKSCGQLVHAYECGNLYIWNNTVVNNKGGIEMYSILPPCDIRGNHMDGLIGDGIGGSGVMVNGLDGAVIEGNDIANCSYNGVVVMSCGNVRIENNSLRHCGRGIYLQDNNSDVSISGNDVSDCYAGVTFAIHKFWYQKDADSPMQEFDYYQMERLTVRDNYLHNNTGYGIHCNLTSTQPHPISFLTATNNTIVQNGVGLFLKQTLDAMVSGNRFALNVAGMYSLDNMGARIWGNSFFNNLLQAHDDYNTASFWNVGYPTGGNNWSDYVGSDEFSGPSQDIPGSDGIGDVPHVIYVSARDDYPLAIPRGTDRTPPETNATYDGQWHTSDFFIPFTANDSESGVAETYYSIGGGPVKRVGVEGQPLITTEGGNSLIYWSVDNAGNAETQKVLSLILLDKTPPTGYMLINWGAEATNSTLLTINFWFYDINTVSQYRLSLDGSKWDPWMPYPQNGTLLLNIVSGDGNITVYVLAVDSVGLVSEIFTDSIFLDTTPPVAMAGQDMEVNEDTVVAFNGSSSFDGIGIRSLCWTFEDGGPQILKGAEVWYTFITPGLYEVTLTVTDLAGHQATDIILLTVRDITAPVANAGRDRTVRVGETVKFDASDSTDNSEIASYLWELGDGTEDQGAVVGHKYSHEGTYVVNLTVVDSSGNSAHTSITVVVRESLVPIILLSVGAIGAVIGVAALLFYLNRRNVKSI